MTRVQERENGQFVVTVPKRIAEGMEIEQGTEFNWKVKSRNRIELEIERE